jgi:cytochrome c oxidase cbb3-type subunit I/II
MRMNAVSTIISAAISVVLLSTLANAAQASHVGGLAGNAKHGEQLYRRYCIFCHGQHGDGMGESALYLNPKPRDFTLAAFKCRSTPAGSLPLDSDLYDTISRGIYASSMPSWNALTRQQRVDLIAYIKSFAPRFREEQPAPPLAIPVESPNSAESVQRGADLFRMNCQSCHGKEGRGNGPVASALTDSKRYPITPYDFTNGKQFKCGESDRDLFRDVLTGLDGTPMPSFADALKPDQIWDLVHYVKTLRTPGRKGALIGQAEHVDK